jgi:ribosomal protein L14E/L6E/L27E
VRLVEVNGVENGELELGQVVKSKAGRDKDRYFIVVGQKDEQYVYLADGDLRKLDKPKKKKIKHVARCNIVLNEVRDKLNNGKRVTNAELRRHLKNLGYL